MRSRKYIPMLMLLALLSCAGKAGAQTVAVKSDLLTGGMLASPNLGVELKLSERFTLEAGVYYNPFPAGGDKRWKHWFVQPELRYWMCQPSIIIGIRIKFFILSICCCNLSCYYCIIYTKDMEALVGAMKFLFPLPVFSPQCAQR